MPREIGGQWGAVIITTTTLITTLIGANIEPPKAENFVTKGSCGLHCTDVSARPCLGHIAGQWKKIWVCTLL